MVHGGNGLPKADSSVVGGDEAVEEDGEAVLCELFLCQAREQMVLEDAAAQGNDREMLCVPQMIACPLDLPCKPVMEEIGKPLFGLPVQV